MSALAILRVELALVDTSRHRSSDSKVNGRLSWDHQVVSPPECSVGFLLF